MSQPAPLMAGKRGLIMGVANKNSIAWGIARTLHANGADLAFTYQGEALGKRVIPLAQQLDASLMIDCDVENDASIDSVFDEIGRHWGELDFVIHAIAFSDKEELKGRYVDTTRDNFLKTMDISCYSFTSIARRAAPLMKNGGSLVTLSFSGANRVMPNYNVMGVAKAALEASVRYLAADLGDGNIRVNAISAGAMRTLAGAAIGGARHILNFCQVNAPLEHTLVLEDIGGSALYLVSDLSSSVTGEVHNVDSGYSIMGMPDPRRTNNAEATEN